jgi:hypothetical protein
VANHRWPRSHRSAPTSADTRSLARLVSITPGISLEWPAAYDMRMVSSSSVKASKGSIRFDPFARQLGNEGVDGAPNGIDRPKMVVVRNPSEGSRPWLSLSGTSPLSRGLGWILARKGFQVHAVDAKGEVVAVRKLTHSRLVAFFSELPPCVVAMEACSPAHYWRPQLPALGFEVRLSKSRQAETN